MSFIVRVICLSHEGLQRVGVKQLCGYLSKSVRASKGNLHCPPIKVTFCRCMDRFPQTTALPLKLACQSWTFSFSVHIRAAELFRQAPISPIWKGRKKCMVLPGRRLYLLFDGGFRLFREPLLVAVTLCHTQKLFLLSLSVSSPRLLPALCQRFDFCQLWPGPFSYLLSFQLCSA